jgi:hypothetical protein
MRMNNIAELKENGMRACAIEWSWLLIARGSSDSGNSGEATYREHDQNALAEDDDMIWEMKSNK